MYLITQGGSPLGQIGLSSTTPLRALKRRTPRHDWQVPQTLFDGFVQVILYLAKTDCYGIILFVEATTDEAVFVTVSPKAFTLSTATI